MLQVILITVLCKLTADMVSRSTGSNTIRISTLDHKAIDYTMEDQSIVKSLIDQRDKIVDCDRSNLRI